MAGFADRLKGIDMRDLVDESGSEITDLEKQYKLIPKHAIYAESQVRKYFDEETLLQLAKGIEENGQEQPIIVYPQDSKGFKIQKGERRYRAAMLSDKITHLECIVRDTGNMLGQLMENIQRDNLLPLEVADALLLLKKEYGVDGRGVAKLVCKSETFVSKHLSIVKKPLPDFIRERAANGQLTDIDTINELRKAAELDEQMVRIELEENSSMTRKEAKDLRAKIEKIHELSFKEESVYGNSSNAISIADMVDADLPPIVKAANGHPPIVPTINNESESATVNQAKEITPSQPIEPVIQPVIQPVIDDYLAGGPESQKEFKDRQYQEAIKRLIASVDKVKNDAKRTGFGDNILITIQDLDSFDELIQLTDICRKNFLLS